MDQKGKHASKENWGDNILPTTIKPGVTDLRPYTKNDLPMNDVHYHPSDSTNLMRRSYSNDIFETAFKSKITSKFPNGDLRYMKHKPSNHHLHFVPYYPCGDDHKRRRFKHLTRLSTLLIKLVRVDNAVLRCSVKADVNHAETQIENLQTSICSSRSSISLVASKPSLSNSFLKNIVPKSKSEQMLKATSGNIDDEKVDDVGREICGNLEDSNDDDEPLENLFPLKQIKTHLEHSASWYFKWDVKKIWPDRRQIHKMTYNLFPRYKKKFYRRKLRKRTEPELQTYFTYVNKVLSPIQSSSYLLESKSSSDRGIFKPCKNKLNLHLTGSITVDHVLQSLHVFASFQSRINKIEVIPSYQDTIPLCKACVMSFLKTWLFSNKMHLYEYVPCAYTLIKQQIINCSHLDDISLLKLIYDGRIEGRSKTVESLKLNFQQRFYFPEFNNRLVNDRNRKQTYTTRLYHQLLKRWRALLNDITRRNMEERVHGDNRKQSNDMQLTDSWLSGGSFGSRNSVLVFRSSALAQSSEADIQMKPGHKLHITFRVVQAETKLLAKLLDCHGVVEASIDSNDFNILWTGSHPKPGILRSMAPHQRVNHFPRSYELTRKDRLYKNIEKMQHAKGFKHFDFIPQTFLMPTEYRELCSTHHRVKGPWIVKPAASSRGRGIYIVESPNQVPIEEPVVVAKYISKPLLIKGHKCDLRLYVAVTSFDPLLIYIYEEGMVRFATVKYDTTHKQLWNPCMHLCNYSINKYHSDYVKSDDPSAENVGHKWTLSALLRHLKSLGHDTAQLMTQVEDLVIKAILASGNSIITACKMFVPNSYNCFELYGFDILIDENLKPWLLEVNLSPSLGCDSPLDVRLKSAMLADLLTLVGIPAVDPMVKPSSPPSTTSTKALKMKMSNCRQIHSAEGLSNHTLPKKASRGSISQSNSSLTSEDAKMIKNAKNQFLRRGGFVRIFPAVDSWTKYAQYLDPVTGIPIAGSNTSIPFSFMGQHNNNQILYGSLYPEMAVTPVTARNEKNTRLVHADRKRDGSLDSVRRYEGPVSTPRQDRYERKLSQGHRSTLSALRKPLREDYSADLKKQVCDMIKNGKKLSQVEARRAFSQYLLCVLKRISSSPDQDGHIEIVLKFLQKASTYLKNPFYVKIPSHKLSEKDRAAIVAKQLNDFLYLYNRETELYANLDRPSHIPKNVFNDFLEHSRESDLEELLILQNIHTVPNQGNDSNSTPTNVNSFQGLLRCLPSINSICFSSPEATKKPVKVTPLS